MKAQETETSGDGITFVKGSDQPTATGTVSSYDSLSESYAFLPEDLDDIDTAYLLSDNESEERTLSRVGAGTKVTSFITLPAAIRLPLIPSVTS